MTYHYDENHARAYFPPQVDIDLEPTAQYQDDEPQAPVCPGGSCDGSCDACIGLGEY